MQTQLKKKQLNNYVLFSTQNLPDTISNLFAKIDYNQSVLHKLLAYPTEFPEKKVSTSLKIFLSELQDRLQIFILNFDELAGQLSLFKHANLTNKEGTLLSFHSEGFLTRLSEILRTTNYLCDLFILLDARLKKMESQDLLKDLVHKALIFYKQTNVVLKGYLRIYKV